MSDDIGTYTFTKAEYYPEDCGESVPSCQLGERLDDCVKSLHTQNCRLIRAETRIMAKTCDSVPQGFAKGILFNFPSNRYQYYIPLGARAVLSGTGFIQGPSDEKDPKTELEEDGQEEDSQEEEDPNDIPPPPQWKSFFDLSDAWPQRRGGGRDYYYYLRGSKSMYSDNDISEKKDEAGCNQHSSSTEYETGHWMGGPGVSCSSVWAYDTANDGGCVPVAFASDVTPRFADENDEDIVLTLDFHSKWADARQVVIYGNCASTWNTRNCSEFYWTVPLEVGFTFSTGNQNTILFVLSPFLALSFLFAIVLL